MTQYNECPINSMLFNHCVCGQQVCPKSIYTGGGDSTLELIVLNYCSTDLECIRNDYASYSVFPYNGGITGANPSL